jgi:hypothetical protein
VFLDFWHQSAAKLIKKVQQGDEQEMLRLMANETKPVGAVDPYDVRVLAAKLLLDKDTLVHSKAKYVLNGQESSTGAQIVVMVEERIGAEVENIAFRDNSMLDEMMAASLESKHLISTIKDGAQWTFASSLLTMSTSEKTFEDASPKGTSDGVLALLLKE